MTVLRKLRSQRWSAVKFDNLRGKTYVLGVGAQKSATTWLFKYLSQSDQVATSPIKEMHFFSSKVKPHIRRKIEKKYVNKIVRLAGKNAEGKPLSRDGYFQAVIDRLQMCYDDDAYLAHFNRLMTGKQKCFCEISPSYAILPVAEFRNIQRLCNQYKINLKVIYLLRDPVERFWSSLRHNERKQRKRTDKQFSAIGEFSNYINHPRKLVRASYNQTINNLLEVFKKDQLFFGFYENLFDEDYIKKITDFIGIDYHPADFSKAIKPEGSSAGLRPTEEQVMEAYRAYEDVYVFCRKYFGDSLPDNWKSY